MEWLVIVGLAALAWWQSQRFDALSRRLEALERVLAQGVNAASAAPAQAPGEPEALLLDTPVPIASNDDAPEAAVAPVRAEPLPELLLTEAMRVEPPSEAAPPQQPAPTGRIRNFEQWLAENALAYVGGGLLALGAVFLVAIATQQSWFGPQARLVTVCILAASLIGAAEWLLRRPRANTLVAALLAGAGVVALYAAAWGAHALYALVDWRGAAALLTGASLLLIALSFRHGQPLGVLAILMGLLAPLFATMPAWPGQALTLFVCGVGAAGFALAGLRRWPWVGAATLLGLYFWFAVAIGADEPRRALALLTVASLGGVALAFARPTPADDKALLSWRRAQALAPAIAICVSSVGLIWVWDAAARSASGSIAGPAWVGAMSVALAAAAVRARVAAAAAFAVATAALAIGIAAYVTARFAPPGADFYPFLLFSAAAVAVASLGARPSRHGRTLVAGAGAVGAALLTAIAAATRPDWHEPAAWLALFVGAAGLLACGWLASREAPDADKNLAVDVWAGGAAVLLILFVESLFPAWMRSAAHASVALTLAAAYAWRRWRALRYATITVAAIAIAYGLRNAGLSISGILPFWNGLAVYALSAGFVACGAFIVGRAEVRRMTREALSSATAILVLVASFVVLRWFAAGGAGAPLDAFTETALQALGLIAAGHVLTPGPTAEPGRIAALRGHALMGAGLLLAALALGLLTNPWWGDRPAQIAGPILFNPLMLAFAAPALLAFAAARRLYGRARLAARVYAGFGGVLALMWAALELRRLFHGANMARGDIGAFEAACYVLVLLGAALAIAVSPRLKRGPSAFSADAATITRAAAWVAISASVLTLAVLRHPWWGGHDGALSGPWTATFAVLANIAAVAAILLLGRALSQTLGVRPTRFAAAAAAAVLAWSTGHALIRWLHHFGRMDDGGPMRGLEAFAHALWPLFFVAVASAITARLPGREAVRAYLIDLQAIWSAAVWPASLFAALGLWILFNPWWGVAPAQVHGAPAALLCLVMLALAAWLSVASSRVAMIRGRIWYARLTRVFAVAHVLVALTLAVRAAFHGGAAAPGLAAAGVEMWIYSAIWALYGAMVLALGVVRDDAVLRWCGLALLFAATIKVFAFDMAQLSGVIRVASFLGLGVVMTLTALAMRRLGQATPRDPQELMRVIQTGGRGVPRVRPRSSPQ